MEVPPECLGSHRPSEHVRDGTGPRPVPGAEYPKVRPLYDSCSAEPSGVSWIVQGPCQVTGVQDEKKVASWGMDPV